MVDDVFSAHHVLLKELGRLHVADQKIDPKVANLVESIDVFPKHRWWQS